MDDVIFAGNPGRPALGRAEVTLTFDNADRRPPLDLDEVAISRTLFRSGDSAYAINATQTRLIDIAEMLSAAGVGRHRHVIVSQGHIDAVLRAKPAERRAILEEAAGVSAYRVRKEEGAATADRHRGEPGAPRGPVERRSGGRCGPWRSRPRWRAVTARWLRSCRLCRSTCSAPSSASCGRAAARRRPGGGTWRTAAPRPARELAALDGRIATAEARLSAPDHVALAEASERLASLEDRVQQAQRAVSRRQQDYERRRQGWLAGDLLASLGEESTRIEAALGELDAAEAALAPERRRLETAASVLAAEGRAHAARTEESGTALEAARERRSEAVAAEVAAQQARATAAGEHGRWRARVEALVQARDEARARSGMEVLTGVTGVLGALGDLVTVEEGWEAAFEAAAGEALAAAVLDGPPAARPALEALVRAGTAGTVLPAQAPGAAPPPVGEPLRPHVRGRRGEVDEALDGLIGPVVVVPTWQEACDAVADHPGATVVTRAGDCFSPTGWRVGAHRPGGTGDALAESRERLESAEVSLAAADRALSEAVAASAEAAGRLAELQRSAEAAEAVAREAAAELQRRRGELDAERRSLDQRFSEIGARRAVLSDRRDELRARLAGHEAAVASASADARRSAVLAELAARLAGSAEECRSGLERLRARQRQLAEAGRRTAARLEGDRKARAELAASLAEVGEELLDAQRSEDELRLRSESVIETLRSQHDCDEIRATRVAQPDLPEGVTAPQRIRELERLLRGIGPVNPLAVREHDILRERHDQLAAQVEDVRSARRDLTQLVRSVDSEILEAFSRCYAEVAEGFETVFGVLLRGRRRQAVTHRAGRPAQLGRGDRGAARGEEPAAPGAAVRRRALPGRAGVPVRGVPVTGLPVLRSGRGGRRPRRCQPAPFPAAAGGLPWECAAHSGHAPEAHDGGRRQPVRRDDAAGRHQQGDRRAPAHAASDGDGRGRGFPRRLSGRGSGRK